LAFVADFGTRNFNFKNKFDMENNTSTNHENGNDANRLLAAVKNWWYKGEGGEWYEPYVTNGDVVICCSIGIVGGFIIAAGCCLL
jgi:hypothetical protein